LPKAARQRASPITDFDRRLQVAAKLILVEIMLACRVGNRVKGSDRAADAEHAVLEDDADCRRRLAHDPVHRRIVVQFAFHAVCPHLQADILSERSGTFVALKQRRRRLALLDEAAAWGAF